MIPRRSAAVLTAVTAAMMMFTTSPALAQDAAPAAAEQQAASASPVPVQVGFQDGFFIQTPNGDYRLVLGMAAQTDGRFSLDTPKPIINTFTLRKIRPTVTGRIGQYFDFKVMPDFGGGSTTIQDAFFDILFSAKFRIRFGKDKTPIGFELLEGDSFLLFPERSLASNLVPNRDIGIQLQGDVAGHRVFYTAGVFNGIPDGTSSMTELDTNNSKDVVGRVVIQPFRTATHGPLDGFGLQVGGSTGREVGPLPSFKTSVQQTFYSYAAGATADGAHNRVSPAVFYYYRSFGGFAEYMRSAQPVTNGNGPIEVVNHAWDVTGSYLITGEFASYGLVRPKTTFDPATGHWGALQILGRVTMLTVDRTAFDAGLAAAHASREAKSFTVGANWYPNELIKFYATFERTTFDNGDIRPPEDVILFRSQLSF